jgi:membrane-associated phospholipid phosphatase
VYLLGRALVANERGRRKAARNADRIVALERRLGIHVEPALQALVLPRFRRTLVAVNVLYVTVNVLLTVGWQMRMFFRREPAFHRFRTAGVASIVAPQLVYVPFPTDAPRQLDHLVDTIDELTGVDLDVGLVSKLYNPIAAFPSIHMAFAMVTSAAILASARSPAARAFAYAYPPAVAITVLVTANHYVLDIVAGTALGLAAIKVANGLES